MAVPTHTACVLSLFLWILSQLAIVEASTEECAYSYLDRSSNSFRTNYRTCSWGCCGGNSTRNPCCSAPLGEVVGSVFGGIVFLVFLIIISCCGCLYCRRRSRPQRRVIMLPRLSRTRHRRARLPAISTPATPGVHQPPPSYEQVMMGQVNPGFKPDRHQS